MPVTTFCFAILATLACASAPPIAGATTTASTTLQQVANATTKFSNQSSTATSIILRTRSNQYILLTSAHVLEQATGDTATLILQQPPTSSNTAPTRREHTLNLRTNGQPNWTRHPTADVALMPLTIAQGQCASIPIESIALPESIVLGDQVFVPGFPAQLEANNAGAPVLRHGIVASVPARPTADNPHFLLSCFTTNGDSGAPVIVRNEANKKNEASEISLLGIIIGLHRETITTTSPVEERTVHRPMSLAIAVHGGIIQDTIELMRSVGP